jgi:uncharacterized protein YecE (DUF72 family)
MTVYLGTSGWQYRDWRGRFYPQGVPQKSWLEFYAERFRCVESNNAFYRLPERKTFQDWARRTPDDFVWAVKMSRYLTHIKRLKDPAEPVKRFLDHARGLGDKLGPILLQLPPNLKADLALLERALKRFRGRERVAVEFRHDSWFVDEVRTLLEDRGVALCLADRGSRPIAPLWRTADWGYVRLHEGSASPHPCYGRGSLESWAQRIGDLWGERADIFVFFNNDTLGCALRDVRVFRRALDRVGLTPTRAPRETVRAG